MFVLRRISYQIWSTMFVLRRISYQIWLKTTMLVSHRISILEDEKAKKGTTKQQNKSTETYKQKSVQ